MGVDAGGAGLGRHRLANSGAVRQQDRLRLRCELGRVRGVGGQVVEDAGREVVPKSAAMKDLDRVVDRRSVLDARVRDRVEHVAGDVGDRQADQASRRDAVSETTALDRRDVLADRVDLDDRGAGSEQELVEPPLLGLRRPLREAGW